MVVVRRIGLNLCIHAILIILVISSWGISLLSLLNVSIKTILLLTTIPARVTIEIPVIVELKGLLVIRSPNRTPTKDITTADKINRD